MRSYRKLVKRSFSLRSNSAKVRQVQNEFGSVRFGLVVYLLSGKAIPENRRRAEEAGLEANEKPSVKLRGPIRLFVFKCTLIGRVSSAEELGRVLD